MFKSFRRSYPAEHGFYQLEDCLIRTATAPVLPYIHRSAVHEANAAQFTQVHGFYYLINVNKL